MYRYQKLICPVLVNLICFVSGSFAGLPAAAELVPENTFLLMEVDDFQQLKAQFEKTSICRLYKDPSMTAFIAGCKNKWNEQISRLDKNDIFKAIIEADITPQGKIAFAMLFNDRVKDSNEPSVVFVTQWGKDIDKVKKAVGKLVEKNIEMGGHQLLPEEYRGVKIESLRDEGSTMFCYCFVDDVFIGTGEIELLRFVIAHLKGAAGPSLADDPDYSSVIAATGPHYDVKIFMNIKQMVKSVISKDSTGRMKTQMSALGLDNIAAAGYSLAFARLPGSSWSGKFFIRLNGPKKGICRMLDFTSSALKAPCFIPSSAYFLVIINLDIKEAYSELYNMIFSLEPAVAAAMNTPLIPPEAPQQRPRLMLKDDIIDNLGSQVVFSQIFNKPAATLSMPQSLFAVGITDRSTLERSMLLLHSKVFNNPGAKRHLLGYTLYLIEPRFFSFFGRGPRPLQASEGHRPRLPVLAFTITDTHILFGFESSVEAAIRTLASTDAVSIDSAQWYRNAEQALPVKAGLAGIEDTSKSVELLWRMLKRDAELRRQSGLKSKQKFKARASENKFPLGDASALPEFDMVRKYFGTALFYGISRPDGFFFEFNYLTPAATD